MYVIEKQGVTGPHYPFPVTVLMLALETDADEDAAAEAARADGLIPEDMMSDGVALVGDSLRYLSTYRIDGKKFLNPGDRGYFKYEVTTPTASAPHLTRLIRTAPRLTRPQGVSPTSCKQDPSCGLSLDVDPFELHARVG